MAQEAVFVVTLSPASSSPQTVNFTTRDGTASAANGDYTAVSGTLTFAPGVTTQQVIVPVRLPLPTGHASELFYVDVSWPTGSGNTTTRGTGIGTLPGAGLTVLPVVSINNVSVS